jgi:DNA polymerase III subunit beta
MQFSIEKENFIKALRVVSGVAEKKSSNDNPILNNALLVVKEQGVFITSTDLDVEVGSFSPVKEVQECGEITVPFRKLHDIIRSFSADNLIYLKMSDTRLTVRSGKSRFALATISANKFPEQTAKKWDLTIEVVEKDFAHQLEKTMYAIAEQDVRYYLNGLLLEVKDSRLYAVGADGHRLAANCLELEQKQPFSIQALVPRKSIMELSRILEPKDTKIVIKFSKNSIAVSNDLFKFTSKLLEGRFPDYHAVVPANLSLEFVGKRDLLRETFLRASALFTEKMHNIKINLTKNCLQLIAKTKDQDEVEEELEVEYDGADFSLAFNGKYLVDFLSVTKTELIKFKFSEQKNSAAIIEGVGDSLGFYVLMPIRD